MSDSSFTPELADVLRMAVQDVTEDWHTSTPATVLAYNAATQRVDVQPNLMRTYPDGTVVKLPPLQDIPVYFPKSANFSMTFPVAAGDNCLLVFSERSIEIWKRDGGIVDPRDGRRQHLSDAFAFVGFSPASAPIGGVDATKVQIKSAGASITIDSGGGVTMANGGGTMKLTSDGKFVINGVNDLLQQLITLCGALETATVLTVFGPSPILPPEAAIFTQVKSAISAMKG